MTTMLDTRSAAQRLSDAQAELAAAEAALAPASAAVDRARDEIAAYGATKATRSAFATASHQQARRQEELEQARASVRVRGREAAAAQEAEAAAYREAEQARRREEAAKAAVVMRRLRVALEEIRTLDRHPDLPIRHYPAWSGLLQDIGKIVAGYNGWPGKDEQS